MEEPMNKAVRTVMRNKSLFFCAVLAFLGGCDPDGSGESLFRLELPPLPQSWMELLGSPRWLVRYYGHDGGEIFLDVEGEGAELSLSPSRVSSVIAWPYWPLRHLEPGDFRPAGAILPYGALFGGDSPGRIPLSWQGGVEAWFFEALSRAALTRANGTADSGNPRRPEYFDWPAFRFLFSDPAVSAEFRADPWLADWDAIAEKTVRSGFRKRWLGVVETLDLSIPALPGPWISPSPFVPPAADTLKVRGGSTAQAWYSAAGILHCAGTSWILLPWE
ncbi:MAG: hypothetical protein LBF95_05785 [Treponema sp.]|nr:hypothetical protein [Treponema sp.]